MSQDHEEDFPNVQCRPFSVQRIRPFPLDGNQLVADHENAVRNHADILGCMFFHGRDDILAELAVLGSNSDYRAKLGKVKAAKLERFAAMPEEQREIALGLAEEAMNHMIDRVAQAIACGIRGYPDNYCIEYKIESQVSKIVGAGVNGV